MSKCKCAWCQCDLPDNGLELAPLPGIGPEKQVSHGMCQQCSEAQMEKVEQKHEKIYHKQGLNARKGVDS